MNVKYLFPHRFKKVGWFLLIPAVIMGLFTLFTSYEPEVFSIKVPGFFGDFFIEKREVFGFYENNILNEIIGILIIIGGIFVAFSKERVEDEFITKIRLESLVWATYFNYVILLISFVLFYDIAFFWVMVFNMFTLLIFFIVRFHWKKARLNKSLAYEE
ncbi:hypothetical protein [Mesonia sp. K7]|uniref:hypothetical protein n=1 Tax=Mesonia sp. K7 TaxID=2218606 RepID=UPI000DA8B7AF|nr:hypothetical protein [Mesonia sp. K7]PZD77030.1 hypothetical protein DNG35_10335 [Mesonia sp. K7]